MKPTKNVKPDKHVADIGRALRLAAKDARKTARDHGTLIHIWRDGKIVAEKP